MPRNHVDQMIASPLTREEELALACPQSGPRPGRADRRKAPRRASGRRGAVLRASRTELEASGIAGSVAQSIASGCSFDDAAAQQEKMLAVRRQSW